MIRDWWFHPAKWWQVWYPQHGLAGGAVCGAVLGLIISLCFGWR